MKRFKFKTNHLFHFTQEQVRIIHIICNFPSSSSSDFSYPQNKMSIQKEVKKLLDLTTISAKGHLLSPLSETDHNLYKVHLRLSNIYQNIIAYWKRHLTNNHNNKFESPRNTIPESIVHHLFKYYIFLRQKNQ